MAERLVPSAVKTIRQRALDSYCCWIKRHTVEAFGVLSLCEIVPGELVRRSTLCMNRNSPGAIICARVLKMR